MRVRVAFFDIMHVIRRDAFQAELFGEDEQLLVHLGLLGNAVVLQFEEKVFYTERLFEPIHRIARLGDLILHDQIRNFASETAGHANQTSAVLRENIFINARLVIVAVKVRRRSKLDEVFVADLILHQQAKVMILVALDFFTRQTRAGRDIHFAADDGLDAFRASGLIKFNHAMHRAMVGDGQRGEFQLVRPFHEFVQTAGTIEQ